MMGELHPNRKGMDSVLSFLEERTGHKRCHSADVNSKYATWRAEPALCSIPADHSSHSSHVTAAISQVSAVPAVSDMSITPLCARTLHMHTALWVGGITCTRGSPTTGPSGPRWARWGRGARCQHWVKIDQKVLMGVCELIMP